MPKAKGGTPSEEQAIGALRELGGEGTVEDVIALFRREGHSFDKTKTWDRLIMLSRKGILVNQSGTFILTAHV